MPTLFVLGGANGVGKTTWYQTGIDQKYIIQELPFINGDTIVLRELGGYTPENIVKGEQVARERMGSLINENKDFMIESNLSKSSDYDWIANMRKKGYDTVLFFLGTDNVEINKIRVQQRVLEGGHDIPPSLIEHRYQLGLSYIKSKLLEFTEVRLIDVSQDILQEMAHLKLGKIIFKNNALTHWVKESLHIAERLQEKLNISEQNNPKLKSRGKGFKM